MNVITIFLRDRKIILSEPPEGQYSSEMSEVSNSNFKEPIKDRLNRFFKNEYSKEICFEHMNLNTLFNEIKSNFIFIEAAGGLVRNLKNELLVIRRFGRPDLPKGKTEKNETPEEAAIREVEEECGIRNPIITGMANPSYHIYFVKSQRILKKTYWFHMRYSGNEVLVPQLKEAIVAAEWCGSDKIKEYQKTTYPSIMKYFD
jgi:8-oxo-dGTP pyrophosphatase MutT (NUDIX family)